MKKRTEKKLTLGKIKIAHLSASAQAVPVDGNKAPTNGVSVCTCTFYKCSGAPACDTDACV
jgi:hypothetical protein